MFVISACDLISSSSSNSSNLEKGNFTTIEVPKISDHFIQSDSLFENIRVIPLETNDKCLIAKPRRVLFFEDKIFVQDFINHLYQFDTKGKFIKEIGRKGRGPGEFLHIMGFDVDKNGDIFILDMVKILKYSSTGKFAGSTRLKFECFPDQLALNKNGNIYVWGGTNSVYDNNRDDKFALYEISKQGKLVDEFLPLKYKITNSFNRFNKCVNYSNIDPIYGNDTIYKLDSDGISVNYFIDFGENALGKNIPGKFKSLADFKGENSKYYTDVRKFTETKEWIYFAFDADNRTCNAFYSKILNKVFLSKPSRNAPPQNSFIWRIETNWNDNLVCLREPSSVLELMKKMEYSKWKQNLSEKDKMLKSQLSKLTELDNPVLFICKMKKYESPKKSN